MQSGEDHTVARNYATLKEFAAAQPQGRPRRIIMRFLASPVEIIGSERVEALRIVKNEICEREHFLHPCPTDEYETIPGGLIFRSIGYYGVPVAGVPFDRARGIIPNRQGRIVDENGGFIAGEYAVGWIKRGPSGVIGTAKPDAAETVERLLEDVASGYLNQPSQPARAALEARLWQRGVCYVTYEDWRVLDQIEIERGALIGRPRLKFSRVADMLDAIEAWTRETTGVEFSAPSVAEVGGVQDVRVRVKGGYDPDRIVVKAGRPVRFHFYREEEGACSEMVVFDGLDRSVTLPAYEETMFELTPVAAGEYSFQCQMGMLRGRLVVE